MKKRKQTIYLEMVLRFMATTILRKYNPRVVGITGSVGKTSAKEAIFLVLSAQYNVRKNEKNYNNEIGIPLTILGAKTGGRNILKWLMVFCKWIYLWLLPAKYPEILVLEMAIDRPGDMRYLTKFIPIEVGVLTDISQSHLEFFKDIEAIAREKSVLIKSISKEGLAILNIDNNYIKEIAENVKNCQTVKIGFTDEAEVRAENIKLVFDDKRIRGLSFKLNYRDKIIPIRLPYIIAKHHIYAVLMAVAVGDYFGINIMDMAKFLKELKSPAGRMNTLMGINNSILLDDTYNASPTSTLAALGTLRDLPAKRRIAVLGDMLELGNASEKGHRQVIQFALENRVDALVLLGEQMEKFSQPFLRKDIFSKKLFYFSDPTTAGKKLAKTIRKGDVVLVKGSQGMRMEKVLLEIMAEPKKSKKLLCRQSREWRKI